MCSSQSAPVRWHYVASPVHQAMPEFPSAVSEEEIACVFPEVFTALVVSMFLNEDGYIGYEDDDNESIPGCWYALSWGCIHRDTLAVWRPRAARIRATFWKRLWRWMMTRGTECVFPTKYDCILTWIAFFNALPMFSYRRALSVLIQNGFLHMQKGSHEGEAVWMYIPTPALGQALLRARAERN